MPSNQTGAQKRRKRRNKKNGATVLQGGLRIVEGKEPTLKTPALQRELEAMAKNGIELELQEVEQTATSNRDKDLGSEVLPNSSTTKRMEDTIMNTTSTTSTPNAAEPTPGVTNENWGPHTEARLRDIGKRLDEQSSPAATLKQAAVTTGAVVVGGLAVNGLMYLIHRTFGAPAAKRA